MNKERQYKEPPYKIDPKTAKRVSYFLLVLRIALILACIWGVYVLLTR
ncbi:MAG: hypothetical protein PHG27_01075 [Massilibacteroides sp.]|nr:hypothetical protein [Massilibacteroides sp.]MDD3063045.1 hypothetical protein [Massilibacteroides sp.]MDD4114178.1 hypothetical protein [Massilibacteroides sp.]MDD4660554.1 hypothetical protein [Massilibacteroides sp.]